MLRVIFFSRSWNITKNANIVVLALELSAAGCSGCIWFWDLNSLLNFKDSDSPPQYYNTELFVQLSSFCMCLFTAVPPHVWVCAEVCFLFPCVFRILPIWPVRTVSVGAVLSLTMAGSREHVAVIKSKEIGKRERGEIKRLCGDFAKKKKKIVRVVERKIGGK